jgi:hypothetical protein
MTTSTFPQTNRLYQDVFLMILFCGRGNGIDETTQLKARQVLSQVGLLGF